jgi:hypothetical protein
VDDNHSQYHSPQGYVYTKTLALETSAIWEGVDELERRGISLEAIGLALQGDWQTIVHALAILGRRP